MTDEFGGVPVDDEIKAKINDYVAHLQEAGVQVTKVVPPLDFYKMWQTENPQQSFAIEYNGEFAGSIGLVKQNDVYRLTAEIGYWLGEPFWGQGIATKAVKLIAEYGFSQLELIRIYSGVFDFNKASQRVLEKAGFTLECIVEKAVIKNENVCDEYGMV